MDGSNAADKFLTRISAALQCVLDQGDGITTQSFSRLMETVMEVFDMLGPVLYFAKAELQSKCESLKKRAETHGTLRDLVKADKDSGTVTVKNSPARNLHRLNSVLIFMRILLDKLCQDTTTTPKDAATVAYQEALAPIHPYIVQTAVWAGMYALPTRESFLASIKETEESAKASAGQFVRGAPTVEGIILSMYDGAMPASDSAPASLSTGGGIMGSWWGTSPAPAQ